MFQNLKSKKKKLLYGLAVIAIGLLLATPLKAEAIGFVQRGFVTIGLFQSEREPVGDTRQTEAENPYAEHNLPLKDQHGNSLNIADLKGKVVFINFWATWCPPCVAEMPGINELYQDYADDGEVVFTMISLDRNFGKAKKFLKNKGFDFDIYEPQSALPKEFQSRGIPNTFVLDKNGKIVFSHMGMGSYNTTKFKKFLNDLKTK